MALKKDEDSRVNRIKKNRRRSSWRKKDLQKVITGTLKRIRDEMAEVRAVNNSVKECQEMILTGLDDQISDMAQMSRVNNHVIRTNTRTLQLLDPVIAMILND